MFKVYGLKDLNFKEVMSLLRMDANIHEYSHD